MKAVNRQPCASDARHRNAELHAQPDPPVSPKRSSQVPPPSAPAGASRIHRPADRCSKPGRCGVANSGTTRRDRGCRAAVVIAQQSDLAEEESATTPSQIARPPPSGVGVWCTFRASGLVDQPPSRGDAAHRRKSAPQAMSRLGTIAPRQPGRGERRHATFLRRSGESMSTRGWR